VPLSAFAFIAQGLMTNALQIGRAGHVTIASYLQIIFVIIAVLVPSWLSATGSLFILCSTGIASFKAWKSSNSSSGGGQAAALFSTMMASIHLILLHSSPTLQLNLEASVKLLCQVLCNHLKVKRLGKHALEMMNSSLSRFLLRSILAA